MQTRDQVSFPCSLGLRTTHTSVGIFAYLFAQAEEGVFIHLGSAHLQGQGTEKS